MKRSLERGAAAVEFALIAMLLIAMLVGVMEGGRLWFVQANLAAAARDGAREMAIKNDQDKAREQFDSVFSPIGGTSSDSITVDISPSTGACDGGVAATFEATYTTSSITGFLDFMWGGTIKMQGVGEMRCGG